MKKYLIYILFLNYCFGASASVAIGLMDGSIQLMQKTIDKQNDELKKNINLEKKILLENKRANFYAKQRNELIMNAWHIQAESTK